MPARVGSSAGALCTTTTPAAAAAAAAAAATTSVTPTRWCQRLAAYYHDGSALLMRQIAAAHAGEVPVAKASIRHPHPQL